MVHSISNRFPAFGWVAGQSAKAVGLGKYRRPPSFLGRVRAQQLRTSEFLVNQSQAGPGLWGAQWLAVVPPDTRGPGCVFYPFLPKARLSASTKSS